MSLIKFFGFIHIFFIFFCFFATWENLFMNNIIPQFICSTFEKNITIDFDSTMLNSLKFSSDIPYYQNTMQEYIQMKLQGFIVI